MNAATLVSVRVGRKGIGRIRALDAKRLKLAEGQEWTESTREGVERALIYLKAKTYASNALSARPLSQRQLETKLTQRKVPADLARAVCADLVRVGALNDAALATTLAGSELRRKPAGKILLVAKLRRRGIDQSIATKAVAAAIADTPDYNPRTQALILAKRKLKPLLAAIDAGRLDLPSAKRRLFGVLARRGFDPDACIWAVAQCLAKGASSLDDPIDDTL